MIPVPLFSTTLLVVLGVSSLAVLALLIGLLVLALFRSARQWWGRHRVLSWSLLVVLLILCFPQAYMAYVWHVVGEEMQQEAAVRHPTLTEPAHIRGLEVPAGTRLSLPGSHDWQAAEEVEFPSPTLIHGVPALAVRFSSTWDEQAPAGSSVELPVHELRIAAPATVDGWHCSPQAPLRLAVRAESEVLLMGCQVAAGNRVADLDIPPGSELLRYTTTYGDGLRDPNVWRIDVHAPLQLAQLPLSGVTLLLDRERKLFGFESANLARDFTLGEISYPAGTQLQSVNRTLRDRAPGAWLFTPVDGKAALHADGRTIPEGMTVVQQPDGRVEGELPNERAGVFVFDTFDFSPDDSGS
ncbi:hypothetical protein UB43_11750 [Pseudomonas sp. 21]|uniref:hypothetical protein n=1 Tax=unclassified Pseudomonas TaxID=196821 RepID=UPI0005EB001C|nr:MULTISPECIES: hypothetical protein [unclassified Pseudomonas]KJK01059.1 hypothetical protein UB43_11750 [Pseudomonas sp. 21]MBV7581966.1 hypothetical protein [Pseudomonas sp. PDM33]